MKIRGDMLSIGIRGNWKPFGPYPSDELPSKDSNMPSDFSLRQQGSSSWNTMGKCSARMRYISLHTMRSRAGIFSVYAVRIPPGIPETIGTRMVRMLILTTFLCLFEWTKQGQMSIMKRSSNTSDMKFLEK